VYICICNAVTDSDIRQAANEGVRNIRQLKKATGCAVNCGSCEQMAREVLTQALEDKSPFLKLVARPVAA
jgi:bacterioferritin-associated ferredoxin